MQPQTVAQLIRTATQQLEDLPHPGLDAEYLFRGVSGMSRAAVLTRGDEPVVAGVASAFEGAVARRRKHEPIQYILGTAPFWRAEFMVTEAVLIPRPETEILVETVAAHLGTGAAATLLDIGTGSGCIALSLLQELPRARALGVDVSAAALSVAVQNSKRLGMDERAEFRLSHWLSTIRPDEIFDAIVSNPPYVARTDQQSLPRDVRDFEPPLALFADMGDDLSSYRALAAGFDSHLAPGGLLAFEVGMGQADRVAEVLSLSGLNSIKIVPDLAAIPRVVLGRKA